MIVFIYLIIYNLTLPTANTYLRGVLLLTVEGLTCSVITRGVLKGFLGLVWALDLFHGGFGFLVPIGWVTQCPPTKYLVGNGAILSLMDALLKEGLRLRL